MCPCWLLLPWMHHPMFRMHPHAYEIPERFWLI
jgi:hypothetical protein